MMTSPRILVKTWQLKEISTGSSTTNVAHLIVNLGIQSRRSYLARRCIWIFWVSRTPDWEPLQKLDGKHQLSIARFEMIIPKLSRALSLWQHRRASASQITKYSECLVQVTWKRHAYFPQQFEKTHAKQKWIWAKSLKVKITLTFLGQQIFLLNWICA